MLEFSNLIKVIPIVNGSSNSSTVYEFIADTFSFVPKLTESESGSYWNCDKVFIVDNPPKDVFRFFSIERNAIIKIKTSNRRDIQLGENTIPARVQLSGNLNTTNLIVKCKMLKDPLSL